MYSHKAFEEHLKQVSKREIKLWKSLDRFATWWAKEYVRNLRLAHRLQKAKGIIVPEDPIKAGTDFDLHFLWLDLQCRSCRWRHRQDGPKHCFTCIQATTLGTHEATDTNNWQHMGD